MDRDKQSCPDSSVISGESVAASTRSAWSAPTITRIEIKRTMAGASVALDSSLFTTH